MSYVSVVIPVYNHERYVEEAVRSVLDQTMSDFEVIVVDDGSSDRMAEKVARIKDSRVRLVTMSENRAVHARNHGLALAGGKYVAFQNSDDRWAREKLERQVAALESMPSVVACFTAVQPIDERGNTLQGSWADALFTVRNRSRIEWLRRFFEQRNCLCITSALVRREALEAVGRFRESLVQMGDLDLWVRLAALGDFHILETPLTEMRVLKQERNLSAPTPQTMRRSSIEYAEVLLRYAKEPVAQAASEAFSFVFDERASTSVTRVAGLARYAWQFGVAHHLFADRVLAGLIDNPHTRTEIVAAYGNHVILDFLKKRGELEILLPSS